MYICSRDRNNFCLTDGRDRRVPVTDRGRVGRNVNWEGPPPHAKTSAKVLKRGPLLRREDRRQVVRTETPGERLSSTCRLCVPCRSDVTPSTTSDDPTGRLTSFVDRTVDPVPSVHSSVHLRRHVYSPKLPGPRARVCGRRDFRQFLRPISHLRKIKMREISKVELLNRYAY